MATYTNATVGYGTDYTVNLLGTAFADSRLDYAWGWNGSFYVIGRVLDIERTDRVNGLTIDVDWDVIGNDQIYTVETDDDGDTRVMGSVVFAKDGSALNDVTIERGVLLLNQPDENNPQDNRWTTTVNGLDIIGEYAVVLASADTSLRDVNISNGAFFCESEDLAGLTVSNLGRVLLYNGSTTDDLVIRGGFVQTVAGAYVKSAEIRGGEMYLASGAAVDDISVRDGGILLTEGVASIRNGLIGRDGVVIVTDSSNSLMDFDYEAGAKVSIGTGVYNTDRASGLKFADGVIVGYGFNNANLNYAIGNLFYSVSANESKNYVAAMETVEMSAGQTAYNMTIEDGGALIADGGKIEGLKIRMNYALIGGNTIANSVVLQSPELIDSYSELDLYGKATATDIRVYDNCRFFAFEDSRSTKVFLNGRGYCEVDDTAQINTITVNDAASLDIVGSAIVKNLTVNSGVVEVAYNGKIESLKMNGGAVHSWDGNNRLVNVQQYGGTLAVQGTVDGITVYGGARLAQIGDPESSGTVTNLTVKDGAWISIYDFSTISANFDPSKVTVGYNFDSGYVFQEDANESYKYIVSFYNNYYVNRGQTAREMCISVGNTNVYLLSGGKMIGGDIENGCLTVDGGATMTGTINLYGETYYMDDIDSYYDAAGISFLSDTAFIESATFNFVLGNNQQLEDYNVNTDLTGLGLYFAENYGDGEEMFDISLTIDADLKLGETYSMYLGSGFKMEGVDVYDKKGKLLGTVTAGKELVADGKIISIRTLNNTNQIYDRQWAIYVEATEPGNTDGDIDGNGMADVLMNISRKTHRDFGASGAWLIQSNQTAKWGNLSTLKDGGEIMGIGTLDSSKDTDDIFVYDSQNRTVGAWVTNDKGNVAGWKTVTKLNNVTEVIGLGDFNGDGETDLLMKTTSGDIGCFYTDGPKTGWNYFQSVGKEWEVVAVGDFNDDGRSDLVLKHDAGFAGCWLTNVDGTVAWSSLDTIGSGYKIIGAGDFNGDGTDDVLLQKDNYFGAWIVENGNATEWMGLGKSAGTIEQIADFNGDGVDDLRLRTDNGDIGVLLVNGADDLTWKYFGSVGSEWNTAMSVLA
ncbi:MAG: hypothetical protein IJW33_06290 [Lentisphaeria bacterium]|nr:hypothetical protein [Lentisphaeria bacterium]